MAGGVVKIGPWGYKEGPRWDYQFNGCKLTKITVVSTNRGICSIQFTCLVDNNEVPSPPFGDNNPEGGKTDTVIIADGEKLTEISGTAVSFCGVQFGEKLITSLGFKVGTKTYGPYGTPRGTPFSLPVDSGDVSGFFGNCGKFLDSLGVIISPINGCVVKVGPWGGDGGDPWEFSLNGRKLTKITLWVSKDCVICIQFTFVVDNQEVPSPPFGDNNPYDATVYKVDIPIPDGEKLTGMSGTVGPYPPQPDNLVITSLSFQVGTQSSGPYGPTNGTPFSLPVDSGDFSGFFGRRGDVLNSLGVMLSPINQ